MKLLQLSTAASLLLAIGVVAAAASLAPGSHRAMAGAPPTGTPTATPCPTAKMPIVEHGGCGTPTATPTSQHPFPCSALMPGPPAAASTRGRLSNTHMSIRTPCMVTMTPTPTATPCPTAKVPDTYHGAGCGTPTPTPTSQRPYGADLRLLDHYPSPAISGRTKTWVFEIENVGSQYGCGSHEISLSATMTGLADNLFQGSAYLGCHEIAEITVASIVTAPSGGSVTIDARAYAGASSVMGHVTASDAVVLIGDVNCDGYRNAIDALLILQYHARLLGALACAAGDVNVDGVINSIDAFLLLQISACFFDESGRLVC